MIPSRPSIGTRRSHRTHATIRGSRTHAVSVFLAALLIASALCEELGAQSTPKRGLPDAEALQSSAVPQGEIRGIVIDAETGDPIEGAQVYLENTQRGALTDSSGHFHIRDVPYGPHVLVAERLAYASARVSVQIPPRGRGIAARFALHPQPIAGTIDYVCGCRPPCGTVQVVVRDVLTSRAPPSPVALRVTRDSILDWDLGHVQDAGALRLAAGSGEGTFAVEVAADGYAPWYREDVRVEGEKCPPSVTLSVWLIPVAPEP